MQPLTALKLGKYPKRTGEWVGEEGRDSDETWAGQSCEYGEEVGSSPSPHLVLGQQLAPPLGVGDIMEGEAQVVVTVLKQKGFWLFHQVASQSPFQLKHLLQTGQQEEEVCHRWKSRALLLQARAMAAKR